MTLTRQPRNTDPSDDPSKHTEKNPLSMAMVVVVVDANMARFSPHPRSAQKRGKNTHPQPSSTFKLQHLLNFKLKSSPPSPVIGAIKEGPRERDTSNIGIGVQFGL
jgi:hypothetical protein